jgi:hypothetical protein
VIYLYFSSRAPDYAIDLDAVKAQAGKIRSGEDDGAFVPGLMSGFPHLVNGELVKTVAAKCAGYAECISSRGMGHALISRFTGQPVMVEHTEALGKEFSPLPPMARNDYYPSPQMHEDASAALLPVVKEVLAVSA